MTPAGIEPATFRFVAQHLNHCATAVPNKINYTCDISELKKLLKTDKPLNNSGMNIFLQTRLFLLLVLNNYEPLLLIILKAIKWNELMY